MRKIIQIKLPRRHTCNNKFPKSISFSHISSIFQPKVELCKNKFGTNATQSFVAKWMRIGIGITCGARFLWLKWNVCVCWEVSLGQIWSGDIGKGLQKKNNEKYINPKSQTSSSSSSSSVQIRQRQNASTMRIDANSQVKECVWPFIFMLGVPSAIGWYMAKIGHESYESILGALWCFVCENNIKVWYVWVVCVLVVDLVLNCVKYKCSIVFFGWNFKQMSGNRIKKTQIIVVVKVGWKLHTSRFINNRFGIIQ